ncbi:pilus assembly protein TadG-related protein [Pseudoroseicyclus sp. CXY001]|uniref:pilus assembly protein TadG-related protein n=1 Tax=Pseudoroseicyclus sp. CXY001 TaxID=3242492 RepID=UPI0035713E12
MAPERFLRAEEGSASIWGIFVILASSMVMGLAIDYTNGWREQTRMQVAADAAALAAATRLDDLDTARQTAIDVAAMNLGDSGMVAAEDVEFGTYDPESLEFVEYLSAGLEAEEVDAVRVWPRRTAERGNELSTYLLRLVGTEAFSIGANAVALAPPAPASGGTERPACSSATFLSTGHIQTGGGNSFYGDTCIHGEGGVATGGNDYLQESVRFSAPSLSQIYLAPYSPSNVPPENYKVERSLAPVILPTLSSRWTTMWNTFWNSTATTYSGPLLPDFMFEGGPARIVRKSGWWTVQPGDVQPNTIYVINGGAQFAGNVQAHNVAFIVNGQLGVGGGNDLHFEDFFVFADRIQLAGNITWGPRSAWCDADAFSVYLFGRSALSMGGWGKAVSSHNVLGVAPDFNPGGAMTASGIYYEFSNRNASLGGNISIGAECAGQYLESHYGRVDVPGPPVAGSGPRRAHLVR